MSTVSSVNNNSMGAILTKDTLMGSAKTLDQNDFLLLLVKQIQFQNPLNPKSDTDMAAQMAQFTSLQQASQSSSSLAMLQASNLVGNQVTLQVDDKTVAIGLVSGLVMNNGKPQIIVDGQAYNVSQVLSVAPPPPPATAPATTPVI